MLARSLINGLDLIRCRQGCHSFHQLCAYDPAKEKEEGGGLQHKSALINTTPPFLSSVLFGERDTALKLHNRKIMWGVKHTGSCTGSSVTRASCDGVRLMCVNTSCLRPSLDHWQKTYPHKTLLRNGVSQPSVAHCDTFFPRSPQFWRFSHVPPMQFHRMIYENNFSLTLSSVFYLHTHLE